MERTDRVESFRSNPEAGDARFIDAAARTTWEDEGTEDIFCPFSGSAPVGEGLSPFGEPVLIPPVETRGVVGAVFGY